MHTFQRKLGVDHDFLRETGHSGRLGDNMVTPLGMQGVGLHVHMLRMLHLPRLDQGIVTCEKEYGAEEKLTE